MTTIKLPPADDLNQQWMHIARATREKGSALTAEEVARVVSGQPWDGSPGKPKGPTKR